jgi:hypothetical protein
MPSAVFIVAAFCLFGSAVGQLAITYYSGPPSSGCATKLDASPPPCGTVSPLVAPMKACVKICSSIVIYDAREAYLRADTCTSNTVNYVIFSDAACSKPIPGVQTMAALNYCGQAFFGSASMKLTCSAASAVSVSVAIVAAALVSFFF